MATYNSQYSAPLMFSSGKPLPYGQSITILETPVKQNGHWVVNALLSSDELEELFLSTDQLAGNQFIVVRTESSGNRFSHTAVLLDEISKESRKIEDNIFNLLKSS